ncbi:4a-hydroxytetrahydrobiopterin dehydratase [Nocardioides exalbidus]|uniref:Putative pterin-4-alpha-carbinolamine dehydratase n=1 Tax=Nocardioides exalbidus TaxID=402596 RepID=A0A1H4I3C5_9ACTN|nr:VOC family protein [Nocardioides exalbidus]SEB28599.1 4a-hydroxytetrahydrobiopterin dehydratase [Nocardioides exalbidus]
MTSTDEGRALRFSEVQAEVEAGEGLADWRMMFQTLETRFATGDFARGLELVARVGGVAGEVGHTPELDLRATTLHVRLISRDVFGVTRRDLALARAISEVAGELGISADPAAVEIVELALDTPELTEVKPFWRAVLGYSDHPLHDAEVRDLAGNGPALWFQRTEPHDTPRQRFHLDVRVAPELVAPRTEAALAAGGRLVSDEHAPAFIVLADPQGNQVCLTTGLGRD